MTSQQRVARAIRDAQLVLAAYLQPGPRNPEQTINEMFDVLDDYRLLEAVEEIEGQIVDAPSTAPDQPFAVEEEIAGGRL